MKYWDLGKKLKGKTLSWHGLQDDVIFLEVVTDIEIDYGRVLNHDCKQTIKHQTSFKPSEQLKYVKNNYKLEDIKEEDHLVKRKNIWWGTVNTKLQLSNDILE